ncbi:CD83 antigen [Centroberyx affinis]|uniref:CD83 antigen n=1 Tax=Centroberyx affinis TaxID=166261 RepID=UPI003A5BCA85
MLLQALLLFPFYVSHVVGMAVNQADTMCVCGGDCILRCTAHYKTGVQYRAVRWYKVGAPPSPKLSGLVTRSFPNGTTRWYVNVQREVELLDDSQDIFLPNVTSQDSGTYTCHLAAPVGEQNQEGEVRLTVKGCPDTGSAELVKDTYMVIGATVLLIVALLIYRKSYASLKNMIKERDRMIKKEHFLDATLKPLEKKDLELIYTLGPNWSTPATMKHVCV